MKSKILKGLGLLAGIVVLIFAGSIFYLKTMLPNVGPPEDITVEMTAERIAHGKYLAHHVMVCVDCHAKRDWDKLFAPIVPGTEGMGGEVFDQNMGFPGRYISANITPSGIGDWTDGELLRAITTGVSKDGRALFNIMPYHNFAKADKEDILSVIAYIRSLPAIENEVEVSTSDFPVSLIINTIPQKASFVEKPPKSDAIAYGKYLVTQASCFDCHTNQVKGQFVGEPFAGGMKFLWPSGDATYSSNITPHSTGIGTWTKEQFVNRFKTYSDSSYVSLTVDEAEFQSPMPWEMYAGMEVEDLEAIFAYLRSIEPKENVVQRYVVATP